MNDVIGRILSGNVHLLSRITKALFWSPEDLKYSVTYLKSHRRERQKKGTVPFLYWWWRRCLLERPVWLCILHRCSASKESKKRERKKERENVRRRACLTHRLTSLHTDSCSCQSATTSIFSTHTWHNSLFNPINLLLQILSWCEP